ncbi:hypothetical protein AgCh_006165 [Apium graveolens]
MAMLMKNPDIMYKLQNEVRNISRGKTRISEDDLPRMQYLKAVIKEKELGPERFLNNPIDYKGRHFEYLPFGAGRRGCPGIQFAMAVNELALANAVNEFNFSLPVGKTTKDLDMAGATGVSVESRAITQYIAYAYADKGNPLVVIEDQKKMAVVSVWMQVESQQFDAAAARLAWELVFKPMFGKETDNAAVEEHEAKLAKVLDIYESRLTESKYLGGDCFSLADLHHLPVMKYLMGTRVAKLLESRSHVNDWFADIQARPSWQKVLSM